MPEITRVVGGRLVTRHVGENEVVTAPEAAALLGVELRWVYSLIGRRKLHARKPRGRLLIPVGEVIAYAKARRLKERR